MKRFSSQLWTFIIPVLIGLLLAWGIVRVPFLVKLEHSAFVYPERLAKDSFLANPGEPKDFQIEISDIRSKYDPSENFASHSVDQETADLLGSPSLNAANWTFIVNSLQEAGVEHLVIAQELSWNDADELTLRALEHELSQLETFVVGINLENGAVPQKLPPYLENSVIPSPENATDEIPKVNQINPPPSIEAPLYGFAFLEQSHSQNDPEFLHVPLLARWGEQLLPSLELASLIAKQGLSCKDVRYSPGLFLQLGSDGLIIPIDAAGRIKIPFQEKLTPPSAADLLVSEEEAPDLVSLIASEPSPALAQLPYSLQYLESLKTDGVSTYGRLPLWKEAAFLAIFVLILHRRKWRLTGLAALAYFAFPFASGEWLLFSPPLAAAFAFTALKIRGTGTHPEDPLPSSSTAKTEPEPAEEVEEILPEPEEEPPAKKLPKRHSSAKRQPKSSKGRLAKKKRSH